MRRTRSYQARRASRSEVRTLRFLLGLEAHEYTHLYRIMKKTGTSRATVHGHLRALRAAGYLQVTRGPSQRGPQRKPCRLTPEGRRFAEKRIEEYIIERAIAA